MIETGLNYTPQDLFDEVVKRCRENAVNHQAAYNDMVEEVINEHRRVGEMDPDAPLEDLEAQLRGRWDEYKKIADL